MTDSIADGLTKIRNASRAGHPTVEVRASRVLGNVLEVLRQEGFIKTYKPVGDTPAQRRLRVYLKYSLNPIGTVYRVDGAGRRKHAGSKAPAITQLVRVSKPGMRVYRNAKTLPRVLGGLGVAVVTTSKGIMTERSAYQQRIGGEVICYVW